MFRFFSLFFTFTPVIMGLPFFLVWCRCVSW
nr:MAG TPA: Protein of unknown function (DUF3311) [Caudoviricetes sp.]